MSIYYFGRSEKLEKFGALELPKFKTENNTDWVINGMMVGWKNQQPQYYNFLYQTSAKHHAIVDAKSRYTYGKGFKVVETGLNPYTELIELKVFIKNLENSKVIQKCILDRAIQGGFAVEVIYDKAGKRIMPHHLDFSYIRESKPEYDKDGKELPKVYFYTSDWKAYKPKDNKDFTVFHPFDPNESPDKSKRYIIYYKDYRPDLGAYPFPEYMGGLPYIQADAEVGNFVYNNVKQGFTSGYLFNFFQDDLSDEQRASIEAMLVASKHGSENAGNPLVAFNKPGENGVTVTPIQANGQDERYINLNNQIRDEIFTAHTISPLVVGMKAENGFSNNADEIRTAVENFTEGYVKSVQQIFNEFVNGIIDFNGIKGDVYLQRLDPIKPQISESTLIWFNDKKLVADYYGIELPKEITTTTVLTEKQFNTDSLGISDDKYEVLHSEEYRFESIEDAVNRQDVFRLSFAKKIEDDVLGVLNDNPSLKPKEISEILKKPLSEVNKAIKKLNESGQLDGRNVTTEGEGELEETIVVYKYKKRSDISGLDKLPTTRDFCVKYIDLSKTRSFTIDDIRTLSTQEGYDVFKYRGGWYHNPKTDNTTPWCRHIWEARLIRLK